MIVKIVLALLLVFMIYNLFKAMTIMLKPDADKQKMSKFIGRRVLISAIIIFIVIVAVATGIITPNPRPY
ncbi:DUF2909 domain-containing protein [Paraneptunicella aestuarii]|uniref:DUF2909 domain-containing protein n=1 Tax=Paraneptunicella aestuarii TaxID=2831148 RepID=UPI001E61C02F|nr:DUF2909 domain-containing protein [Paraneptunicella aestuarii]UAA38869.1 DUF2909 domain-containing protein [Paraneptunicella aestuarii]